MCIRLADNYNDFTLSISLAFVPDVRVVVNPSIELALSGVDITFHR
jgi:hypothetical protein